jgi:hypothetical protein
VSSPPFFEVYGLGHELRVGVCERERERGGMGERFTLTITPTVMAEGRKDGFVHAGSNPRILIRRFEYFG